MLRTLYNRVLALAETPWALPTLAAVSFAESSFLPIPPDALLAPMVLAKPRRGWTYALVCTLASVAGGLFGYALGFYLTPLAERLLVLMGHAGGLASFQAAYQRFGVWVILIKGLTPIPYKLVTIASGLAHFSLPVFMAASLVTRGARFFLETALLQHPAVRELVDKRLGWVVGITVALLVGAVVAIKLVG